MHVVVMNCRIVQKQADILKSCQCDDNVFLLKLPPNCCKDQNVLCIYSCLIHILNHWNFLDIVSWRYNNLFKPHCTLAHIPGLDALHYYCCFFFFKECVHKFYIVSIVFIVHIKLNLNIFLSLSFLFFWSSSLEKDKLNEYLSSASYYGLLWCCFGVPRTSAAHKLITGNHAPLTRHSVKARVPSCYSWTPTQAYGIGYYSLSQDAFQLLRDEARSLWLSPINTNITFT